jgi:predicted enzyme related to lactoylglutathione lyase
MPNTPKPGAVVFAKELEPVAKFYEKLLALSVKHSEQDHVVLESENFELVIHEIPAYIAKSITIEKPPVVREETPIKLFFTVSSLAKGRSVALDLGGQLNPIQREWTGEGFRACDGHDPEGNVFQLRQNAP